MATRIQIRRDTEANWSSNDPVLASGELALSTDVDKIKIGDSSTAWSGLSYATIGQAAVESLITTAVDNLIGGAPDLLNTLNELAAAIGDDESFITTINQSISDVETAVAAKASVIVSATVPTVGPDGVESLQEGDIWYDRANGHAYMYYDIENESYVWVEMGGSDDIADTALGTNSHNFSTSPTNGDVTNGYVYDSSRTAWKIIRNSTELNEITDVTLTSPAADNVIMYNDSTSEWENVSGIRLEESGYIPLSFLANGFNGSTYSTMSELESKITSVDADIASNAADISSVTNDLATNYLVSSDVSKLTVKSAADWGTDTSTPLSGSLNVETGGSEIKIKIGNGSDTYANLTYVPTNAYIASEIATAIAPLAPKADPTFSGTVSLPSTTSIGDVDATEISYLDGVTSGIQGQLDSLDTLKAPLADPTFTGTVSGVTASMVGLSNVDNTADTDKPVSTAQQAALDTKLNLAGGTMTGKITLDGDPTQALHAATKQYVDSAEAGLSTKPQVVAATTTNLSGTYDNGTAGVGATLNLGQLATLDIDGVTSWSLLDGILLKDQTTAAENGRWVVDQIGNGTDTDWILRRCSLCDTADEIPGAYIFVIDGTTNEQTGWVLHVDDPATFTVGTDDIDVYQFAGAGAVTAGTNVSVSGTQVSVVDAPVFAGTVDASAAGVEFSDGTQTKAGVPSVTGFTEKTASYTIDTLDHQDNIIEVNMSSAGTITIPTDAALAWPVGASMDVFATGTGEITIAGDTGVTVNATPGLILRTQWSSATLLKRGANSWVVYGDLKA